MIGLKVIGAENGVVQVQIDAKDADKNAGRVEDQFCAQFGTDNSHFASLMAEQLAAYSVVKDKNTGDEQVNANVANAHISIVRGIGPRDEVEAMLAVQMAGIHMLTFAAIGTAYKTTQPMQKDQALAQVNKLSRTFTTQMEALKRYRSAGEQKVTVEHVHVHEGGQAVVGNVTHSGKAA
ncbi:MAG: hypothetical protein BGO81_04235 [Devosia sp. 66-22]|nr:MAG: hypothetical protein BGO81_04235 [Devosia sp. 66-22]